MHRETRLGASIRTLALLAASSLVGILLAEGVLRIASPAIFPLSRAHRFDPELGWLQKTGVSMKRHNEAGRKVTVEGEARGIRRPPQPYARGVKTLLAAGDSFTASTQVAFEDSWPALLQRRLAADGGSVQVVNAGVDGYDLAQSYILASRLWHELEPSYLLLSVFVGNDVRDYASEANARVPWQPITPRQWLHDHSFLYHLLRAARMKAAGTWAWEAPPPALPRWVPTSVPGFAELDPTERSYVRRQFAADELVPCLKDAALLARRLDSTTRIIQSFAKLAQEHGAGFGLVLIPTKQQVVPEQLDEWRSLHGLSVEQALAPQTALARWAAERRIDVLDLTPVFAASNHPADLYWRVNEHLAYAGHERMAAAVAKLLGGSDVALALR